ncbi:hypothetical protein K3495_g4106 [Podosphaera aphanis]|nr:hypothetical protein K3495_g4106 [Podosphaera aphanis]
MKMDSSNPIRNSNTLQQKCSRPVPSKNIIPAIPLIYVKKRQKYQAERVRACEETEGLLPTAEPPTLLLESNAVSNVTTKATLEPVRSLRIQEIAERPRPETKSTPGSESEKANEALEVMDTPITVSTNDNDQINMTMNHITEDTSSRNEVARLGKQTSDFNKSHTTAPHPDYQKTSLDCVPQLLNLKSCVGPDCARYPPLQKFATNHKIFDNEHSELKSSPPAVPSPVVYLPPTNIGYPPTSLLHTPRHSNGGLSVSQGFCPRTNLFPDQVATNDMVTRPTPSFGHVEIFSPSMTPIESHSHDPMTPHSFHGSQSPVHDQASVLHVNWQPCNAAPNSSCGVFDDFRPLQTKIPMNSTREQCLHPIPQIDSMEGLNQYLSSQFSDPTFADCTIELRYSDDRAAPIRIPGHSLIFARSITLKNMILASRKQSNVSTSKTLYIESDDRFLCTDGFYIAMHRLYGNPLLDIGPLVRVGPSGLYQTSSAHTSVERFNLALGYAAAGHLLKLDVVVNRGCEIAGFALNWTTLERALDFALDGGLESQYTAEGWLQRSSDATYGPCVNIILHRVIEFICHNFPPSFQINTLVNEAMFVPRLPNISIRRQFSPSLRLGLIKFGDHTTEESQRNGIFQSSFVLSRVLINLPWDLLRCIFEFPRLISTSGDTVHRHQILSSLIQEREKRRLKVYNSGISNAERRARNKEWNAVGWREEVSEIHNNENISKLTRSWVGFSIPETR